MENKKYTSEELHHILKEVFDDSDLKDYKDMLVAVYLEKKRKNKKEIFVEK